MTCWEFKQCGREAGGARTGELGVCPAYPKHGRDCASVAGTMCGGEISGMFAAKLLNCLICDYYLSPHYDRSASSHEGGPLSAAAEGLHSF